MYMLSYQTWYKKLHAIPHVFSGICDIAFTHLCLWVISNQCNSSENNSKESLAIHDIFIHQIDVITIIILLSRSDWSKSFE